MIVFVFLYLKELIKRKGTTVSSTLKQSEPLPEASPAANGDENSKNNLDYSQSIPRDAANSIMIFDATGNLEWINDGFQKMMGYTKMEFIENFGRNIKQISNNEDIQKLLDICVNEKRSVSYIAKNTTKNGEPIWMQTTLTPIFNKEKKLARLIAIDTDITQLKNAEEEILKQKDELENQRNFALQQMDELEKAFKKSSKHHIQLQKALWMNEKQREELKDLVELINKQNVELEKANQEIKESSRLKEVFLANTSHEIRTPLNAIMGFTNLLMSTEPSDIQLGYLKNIKASGDNLLVVINDILDFSKIESGKISFENIGFNLFDMVDNVVSTLNVKAREKNQTLFWKLNPEIPPILMGDPVRLNQIITNLIGNSIKFTSVNGTISLNIDLEEKKEKGVKLTFSVADNGIGIPANKLEGIFESFTQAESDTTRKFGGTGLGLAIVKQLVTLQNGNIWVESELEKGTKFIFMLEFSIGTIDQIKPNVQEKIRSAAPLPNDLKILLVEDNRINQQLALDTLRLWNKAILVDLAENGLEAIEKVQQNDYHLILMDIQMPEMDGREATRQIREKFDSPKKDIPIIAMTAHALKDEKEKCILLGMNDYISKPFDPNDLYNKIIKYGVKKGDTIEETEPVEIYNLEPSSENDKFKNLKYIDLSQLNKIYNGDKEKIIKILSLYMNSTHDEIESLEKFYIGSNWDGIKSKAHVLKTKMNYLGLKDLSEAARLIENFAKDQNELEKISKLIEVIKEDWGVAEDELKSIIA